MSLQIARLDVPDLLLGENPLWDEQEQKLLWIDGAEGVLYRADAQGGQLESWSFGFALASLALRQQGGAIVASERGLHLFDFSSGLEVPFADPEQDMPEIHLNDCKVDPQGRLVVGAIDLACHDSSRQEVIARPRGSIWRVDADLSVTRLDHGYVCGNGPCWSPDGCTFYYADTLRSTIYAADWDGGGNGIRNRRVFVSGQGRPDGATVDADGYHWSAFIGSGEIRRHAPDGSLDRVVTLPSPMVSSVTFGGPDLDILYATTISARPVKGQPKDGGIFVIHGLGVQGIPAVRFAG
jgi:sugar lactone lactonase YvrE